MQAVVKHRSRQRAGGGGRIIPLGVTDERVTAVPRSLQQPKKFIFRSSTQVLTDLTGSLTWGSPVYGGTYYAALQNALSATQGFSVLAANNYDQYVVTDFAIRFVPYNRYSKVSASTGPVVIAYDVDSSSVSATEKQLLDYGTSKVVTTDDPWEISYSIPFSTTTGRVWLDLGSPALTGCLTFGTQSPPVQSATTAYGTVYFEFAVVARGRR
jgi:hypothetical protein